ncbi:MAG: hypothetical protein ACLFPF_04160 [Halanaerobiales bacterium]
MIKALNHISFARDWLARAEEKIRIGSLVDGEVFLSLAESEVRKAWESSYSERKKKKKKKKKESKLLLFNKNRLSLVIGMILILVLFAAGTNYFYNPEDRTEQFKLNLTEGYRNREELDLYSGRHEPRLINVDFMLENNYDRGQ